MKVLDSGAARPTKKAGTAKKAGAAKKPGRAAKRRPARTAGPIDRFQAVGGGSAARQAAAKATEATLRTVDELMTYEPSAESLGQRWLGVVGHVLHGLQAPPAWREWAGTDMKPAEVWPLSQLLSARLDHALLGGDFSKADAVIQELEKYRQHGAFAPVAVNTDKDTQPRYFDDNAWLGLDLVQAYRQTKNPRYLDEAKALVPFLESGLTPRGMLWRELQDGEEGSLNTCANAPSMQLFLALHKETGDGRYLKDAQRCERALNGTLRRADGLYDDNVRLHDATQRGTTLYSYNQGAAVGANLQLAEASRDPAQKAHFLGLAISTADATMRLLEKDPDWLWRQSPAFNAVYFRNLLKLDAVRPDPRYRAALDAYLRRADATARGSNGAYENGGIGRYAGDQPGGLRLIDQSGMAQLFALRGLSPAQLAMLG